MAWSRDNDHADPKQLKPHSAAETTRRDLKNMNAALERIEAQSTITSKGQVTVPAKIMKRLGLKEGDRIRFIVEEDELHVEVISLLSAEELFGSLDRPEDEGHFLLNIEDAREERAQAILQMYPENIGGDEVGTATKDRNLD